MIRVPSANALVFANKHLVMGNFPDEYLFISSKSKNWEAVCRLLNVLCDPATSRMQWSGIEGQWWNYVNGVPTLTDDALRIWSEGGDEVDKVGAGPDCPFQLVLADIANPDGYGTGLFDTDEMRAASLNPLQKDFSNYYKVSYPSEASTRLVDKGLTVDLSSTYSQLISTFVEDMPSDITRIVAKSNDVLYKAIPSLVMAKSDDDYAAAQAQVLKDLQAVGENTAWDWCRNAWGSAETEVTPIIKSIDW